MKSVAPPGSSSEPEAALLWAEGMNDDTPPVAEAFAIMYPWVCNGLFMNNDYSQFWGIDGNWATGKGVPFGTNSKYVNCYYDNEPWDIAAASMPGYDPHNYSYEAPPAWQAYKFAKPTETGGIWGWLIAEKRSDDRYGVRISEITSSAICKKYSATWDDAKKTCSAKRFVLNKFDSPW